jgi:hypothetical protein
MTIKPEDTQPTCECGAGCSCGCQDGRPCTCNNPATSPFGFIWSACGGARYVYPKGSGVAALWMTTVSQCVAVSWPVEARAPLAELRRRARQRLPCRATARTGATEGCY